MWNPIYQSYPPEYIKKYYRHVEPETGRRYALGDLSGPGGKSKGNPFYEFLGIKKFWRYKENRLHELYTQNRIFLGKKAKVPTVKRYLDEMPDIMLQDLWDDLQSPQLTNHRSVTYPTQKPIRLLERIIEISTNPGNLILDPLCGSGTALVAAVNLDRNYLGIDINSEACKLARQRIQYAKRRSYVKLEKSSGIQKHVPNLSKKIIVH